jgi:hypothetical protein
MNSDGGVLMSGGWAEERQPLSEASGTSCIISCAGGQRRQHTPGGGQIPNPAAYLPAATAYIRKSIIPFIVLHFPLLHGEHAQLSNEFYL